MASYSSSCMPLAFLLATLISGAAALQFMVGGSAGWFEPSASYNDWAGKYRLLLNDTLVFKYNPSVDSVLRVSAEDYNSCNISNPIASFKDGRTLLQFSSHGHFYFVSGNFSNCKKGQKVVANVLFPRTFNGQFPGSASRARGPVKGHFWVDNVGCCQDKCCDEEINPICCQKQI